VQRDREHLAASLLDARSTAETSPEKAFLMLTKFQRMSQLS